MCACVCILNVVFHLRLIIQYMTMVDYRRTAPLGHDQRRVSVSEVQP